MSPPTEGSDTRIPREEQEIKKSRNTQSNTQTLEAKSPFFLWNFCSRSDGRKKTQSGR